MRQGDPLSPYLFIIALEILNISIRENKEIIGIKVGNEEIKLNNVFADDLTTFVKNTRSFFSLKQVINNFGYISGLKLNKEKTELYWLGSLHNSPEDLGIDKNKPMKILGIFFTYDWQKFQELNFEKIITSIKKILKYMAMEKLNFTWQNPDHQDLRYS